MARVHLHRARANLTGERRVRTEQQLLAGLTTRIKGT